MSALAALFGAIKLNPFSTAVGGLVFVIIITLGQFAAARFLDAGAGMHVPGRGAEPLITRQGVRD